MRTTIVTPHGGVPLPTSVHMVRTIGTAWLPAEAEQAHNLVLPVVHTVGTTDTLGIGSTWPTPFLRVQQ